MAILQRTHDAAWIRESSLRCNIWATSAKTKTTNAAPTPHALDATYAVRHQALSLRTKPSRNDRNNTQILGWDRWRPETATLSTIPKTYRTSVTLSTVIYGYYI
jgi:hypothetical protein